MLDSTCQPNTEPREPLTALERQYILLTQSGLPIIAKPYHWLARQLNISVEQVITMTKNMQARGVIRRIAAVPNHYKLGYCFNGMTVWDIKDEHAEAFGQQVGKLAFVSHCYLRPRKLPHWNYNLFAMVHGKSEQEIAQYRNQIKALLAEVLVNRTPENGQLFKNCDMLTSTKILKKTGLRLQHKTIEAHTPIKQQENNHV